MGGAAVDIKGKANVTVINGVLSAGVSTGCNSAGTTGTVSNQLIFCGGNNITLSESINGQSATITIIGGAGGAGTTFSAGVSNLSNDSGSTGIVTNQIVFAGGNNITLSQSSNVGGSATVTIIGAAAGTGAGIYAIGAGTQTATSGTILFQDANSISFGMNNSSVITASYEMQSHNSVYHTGIIGAEAQISFDPVSGHDHDGVDSKLIITPQYLEVSEVAGLGESGKQFTSIATAIAAAVAGGAGSAKPYVIRVYPGTYTEPQLVMESYVAVIGSGEFNTIITALDPTNHFIIGATNSYIRDCAIVGPTTNFMAAFYYDKVSSSPFTIQDVLIRQGYYGVWANSATTGGNVHCINVNNWYNGTIMHTFMYATDFGTIVAMNSSFMCGPAAKITRGFSCNSANAEIYMDLCSFRNTPTIPLPNDAVFVDNGGHVKMVACTFSIGTNAIHVGANGTGGYVIAVGCNIRNEPAMGYVFTTDILMDSAGTMQYTGSCTKSKITITNPAAATFSANFTDSTTGEEGAVVYGELWLGTSATNSIPLRDYGLSAYSTGWRTLGQVTRSGAPPSLDVSVAAGSGYINTGTGVTRISWGPAATIKTCAADTSQWVYVDSAGTVTVSATEPNYPDVIFLAAIRTNNNHVEFLADHDISLHQTIPTIYNYLEKIFGPVSFEGCTVTQTVGIGNELKVDFAVGKYFSGLRELQPATTSPVTFKYWYRKVGSSGWNTVTPGGGGSNFDTTQYDDNSGALVALPGGKYKKDLLIVVKNDVGTEFHVIYGQQYFDTSDQAQVTHIFEIPDPFQEHGLQIAGMVVLSGAGVIAAIIDERNRFVSEHNDLRELQGGDSIAKQYYHLNYNEWTSRNQKIIASLLTAGNTAGVMAVISTGTMYLAGGNNITLSQNANSVTISGPNMAIAAGGVTTAASTFTFGDTNGVSFQISNGSIVGSIGTYLTSQSNQALAGSNGSFTFQTATFGNANGLSFYTAVGGSILGSYTVPTQSVQTQNILSPLAIVGNTAGTNYTLTEGAYSLSAGNNITLSQNVSNSNIIVLSVNTNSLLGTGATQSFRFTSDDGQLQFTTANTKFVQGWELEGIQTAGTTSSSQGTQLYLSGGNMMTLSGNSNTIVFSVNTNSLLGTGVKQTLGLTDTTAGGGTGGTTAGGASGNAIKYVFVAGSNVTLSQSLDIGSASGTLSIYGPNPSAAGIAAIGNTASSNAFTSGSVQFSGLANITVNTSINGASQYIQISAPNPAAAAGVSAVANSQTTYTSGLLILSDYANITISSSVNAGSQYYKFSVGAGAGIGGIADSASTVTNQTVQFNNANNVSFGLNGSTMTASIVQQTGISGISATNTLYISGTVLFTGSNMITVKSSGLGQTIILDATHPLQTFIGGIAGSGASTVTDGTVQFGNANNITFGLNGSTMTASASYSQSVQTQSILSPLAIIGNTVGTNYTLQNGQYSWSADNNITLSQNSSNTNIIVISGPNTHAQQTGISGIAGSGASTVTNGTVQFGNANNISFGLNGSTMTASYSQSAQTFIGGIAGSGASTVTNGTVQFQTGNGITFGLNGSTMTASHNALTSQSTAPSGLYATNIATTFTSGNIGFSGSNNITVSTAAQAIIISGPNTHAVQTGISSIGATDTTYTSGGVSLYGSGIISLSSTTGQGFVISAPGVVSLNGLSSNITVSAGNLMSISNIVTTGAQTIHTISVINLLSSSAIAQVVSSASSAGTQSSRYALADHAHAGLGGLGVSNTGTTAGTTGTLAGTWVIAASGNITASGSTTNTALGVNTLWLSVPAQSAQTAISGISATNTLYTSGTVLFTGSNMITVRSSGAGQTIILDATQSVQPAQTGISGLYATNIATTFTSGTIGFSGSNNITVSTAAQAIIISGPNTHAVQTGISSIGVVGSELTFTSGNVIFSGQANITLATSINGASQYIRIAAPAPIGGAATVKIFQPREAMIGTDMLQGTVFVQPINIPYNMTATRLNVLMHISNSASAAGTMSWNVGLYTYTVSTANSISSTLITRAYNSTLGNSSSASNISGTRYRSISLNSWAFTPGDYLLAIGLSVATGLTSGSYSMYGGSRISIAGTEYSGAGNILDWGYNGVLSAATNAVRASFHISDINRTGTAVLGQWWFNLLGTA